MECSLSTSSNCRPQKRQAALVTLCGNFMKLMEQHGGSLDLKSAADALSVPRRRLYDVVNVLEGIGLMHRVERSVVVWDVRLANNSDLRALRAECDNLMKQEASLDREIQRLADDLQSTKSDLDAYLHVNHLLSDGNFATQAVIAVKCDTNETVSVGVSYSADGRGFDLSVKSDHLTPLSGFLCKWGSFFCLNEITSEESGPSASDTTA